MQAQDFLVELGTEELPPKALKKLAEAFRNEVEKGLSDANAAVAGDIIYFAAPRRLAVLVHDLLGNKASCRAVRRASDTGFF